MRGLKILILAFCLAAAAAAQAQYVQPMGYVDYSFYNQMNVGNTGAKRTPASAFLELGTWNSKKGLLLPRGNQDSIPSPAEGLVFYNRYTKQPVFYNGTIWKNFATPALGYGLLYANSAVTVDTALLKPIFAANSATAGSGIIKIGMAFHLGNPLTRDATFTSRDYNVSFGPAFNNTIKAFTVNTRSGIFLKDTSYFSGRSPTLSLATGQVNIDASTTQIASLYQTNIFSDNQVLVVSNKVHIHGADSVVATGLPLTSDTSYKNVVSSPHGRLFIRPDAGGGIGGGLPYSDTLNQVRKNDTLIIAEAPIYFEKRPFGKAYDLKLDRDTTKLWYDAYNFSQLFNLVSPVNGSVIKYNSTSNKWEVGVDEGGVSGSSYFAGYGLDLVGTTFSWNKTLRDSIIGLIPNVTGKLNISDTAVAFQNFIVGPLWGLYKSGRFLGLDTINAATRAYAKKVADSAAAGVPMPTLQQTITAGGNLTVANNVVLQPGGNLKIKDNTTNNKYWNFTTNGVEFQYKDAATWTTLMGGGFGVNYFDAYLSNYEGGKLYNHELYMAPDGLWFKTDTTLKIESPLLKFEKQVKGIIQTDSNGYVIASNLIDLGNLKFPDSLVIRQGNSFAQYKNDAGLGYSFYSENGLGNSNFVSNSYNRNIWNPQHTSGSSAYLSNEADSLSYLFSVNNHVLNEKQTFIHATKDFFTQGYNPYKDSAYNASQIFFNATGTYIGARAAGTQYNPNPTIRGIHINNSGNVFLTNTVTGSGGDSVLVKTSSNEVRAVHPSTLGGVGGTPGGSTTQIQYNNAGAFGGFGTWNGSTMAIPGGITTTAAIVTTVAEGAAAFTLKRSSDNAALLNYGFPGSGAVDINNTTGALRYYAEGGHTFRNPVAIVPETGGGATALAVTGDVSASSLVGTGTRMVTTSATGVLGHQAIPTSYTDALARASISLTTTGTSGVSTYNSATGVLNIPNYSSVGASWNGVYANSSSGDFNGVTLSATNTEIVHTGGTATTTLPLYSGAGNNVIHILNSGSGNLTVQRNTSDNILYHGASATSFVLAPGQSTAIQPLNGLWNTFFDGYNPSAGGSGANALGSYIVQTATNAPANAQVLGTLGTGLVKNTTTTGVLSIATAGTDYEAPIAATTSADYYRGDKTFQPLNKAAVGLANVDNTTDANKPVSTATQTVLDLKANIASPTFTGTVSGITKAMVGLGNVDNTSNATERAATAALTNKDLSSGTNTFPTFNQNTTGSAATLTNTRTIWGQNFNGSANVTGDITLGASSITMTGSIGATGARVTKGWFTDGEFTNMPTVGGTSLSSTFQPLDADLTTIAGLTATTDNFIVGVASAWASRTPAQVKTTLALNNVENTALSTWAGTANITTLGTIATGTWNGSLVVGQYGGTGVNNSGKTITLGGNLITSGAFATTFTSTATTNVTLPTTGTLATLAGAETFSTKTIAFGSNTVSGTLAQFNTAVTDADLLSIAGAETPTNKTIDGDNNTIRDITQTKGITFVAPTASEQVMIWKVGAGGATITNVDITVRGTSPSTTYTLNYGTTYGTAVGTIVASVAATATGAATLNTTSIPANSYIWIATSAIGGTTLEFSLSIKYRE